MAEKPLTYREYNKNSFVVLGDREKYGYLMKTLGARWYSKLKTSDPAWLVPQAREVELKKLIDRIEKENLGFKNLDDEKDTELESIKDTMKSRKSQNKYHRAVSNEEEESDEPSKSESVSTEYEQSTDVESLSRRNTKFSVDKVWVEKAKENNKKKERVFRPKLRERSKSLTPKRHSTRSLAQPSPHTSIHNSKERSPNPSKERSSRHTKLPKKEKRERQKRSPKDMNESDDSDHRIFKYYKSFSKNPSKFKALYHRSSGDESFSSSSEYEESTDDDFPSPIPPKKQKSYDSMKQKYKDLKRKLAEFRLKEKKHRKRS